jgi:hypothetical protein
MHLENFLKYKLKIIHIDKIKIIQQLFTMPLPIIMTTPKNVKQVTFNDRIAARSPLQMSPSYSPTSNSTSGSGGGGSILSATNSPLQIFKSSQQMMAKNVETSTKQNYHFR